jgi:hypothetical protein
MKMYFPQTAEPELLAVNQASINCMAEDFSVELPAQKGKTEIWLSPGMAY